MPEFSTTFLSLMEISDGAYLYAKFLSVQVHIESARQKVAMHILKAMQVSPRHWLMQMTG
jgi:hypothetical protein